MTRNRWTRDAVAMSARRGCRALGVVAAGALLAAGCGASASRGTTADRATGTTPARAVTGRPSPARAAQAVDPGALPQTNREPTVGAALANQMGTLWSAIVTTSTRQGRQVFFPESAYLTMKTGVLPDPATDYTGRLIAFFNLDLAAYHAHLGADPAAARLISVESDPSLAAWIPPGACENTVGYWHLPGTRLVYQSGGHTSSVRVASLISWRGVWYVVHLGPNPRPANIGTVDDPRTGPGVPGPGGGC